MPRIEGCGTGVPSDTRGGPATTTANRGDLAGQRVATQPVLVLEKDDSQGPSGDETAPVRSTALLDDRATENGATASVVSAPADDLVATQPSPTSIPRAASRWRGTKNDQAQPCRCWPRLCAEPTMMPAASGGVPGRHLLGVVMIILGIILLIVGFLVKIAILWTIGIVLLVIGLILAVLGATGRAVAGRRHFF